MNDGYDLSAIFVPNYDAELPRIYFTSLFKSLDGVACDLRFTSDLLKKPGANSAHEDPPNRDAPLSP